MRRFLFAACSLSLALVTVHASADQVVLKDGGTITTAKPYTVKGAQAILTLPDGTLVSIPASQIDAQKTAAANAPRAPKPATAVARPPQSPGEAARMKTSRKATVVLSDEDVQHPITGGGASLAAAGEKGDAGGDRVEVSGITSSREAGKLLVSGSIQNTGTVEVAGVSLTIEAVGDNNKTVASGFGRIAKDALQPGEKTTFTAEFADEGITNVRAVPRWQVRIPVKSAGSESDGSGAPGAAPQQDLSAPAPAPTAAPTAPPAPAAKTEIKQVPRGDIAAPPASGPVGSSSNPNAGYLPQPADVVPTPPPQQNPK